jgi:hypothetical protein
MKLVCIIMGHKIVAAHDKDMFGYEYVWQKKYCSRCGMRVN